jgi:hypothetical protein
MEATASEDREGGVASNTPSYLPIGALNVAWMRTDLLDDLQELGAVVDLDALVHLQHAVLLLLATRRGAGKPTSKRKASRGVSHQL